MLRKNTKKRLPLKTVYFRSFFLFIVIPLLIVLSGALWILNQQFKNQAIINILQAHETIIAELMSDINNVSMRLSHLINANNNEILNYAAGTDTVDRDVRYQYEQTLSQSSNLILDPLKEIIATGFYMKSGKTTYVKNNINLDYEKIKETSWYQTALENKNSVCVGFYETESTDDLFTGGKKGLLILIFAVAPDVRTDRSQRIEMVALYQSTRAAGRIKDYNASYQKGEGKLGITQITDADGGLIFSTNGQLDEVSSGKYTCVKSPVKLSGDIWYVESHIKTEELTEEYWRVARMILGIAVLILTLAGYYSGYFLKNIVKPVEDISRGLKQVEEGCLQVHINPRGQSEIRNMVHQFNAMVRRLKALINEYEEQVKEREKSPKYYLAALINGEMMPETANQKVKEFFADPYAIVGICIQSSNSAMGGEEGAVKFAESFERNSRFASRCTLYADRPELLIVHYRITEQDYVFNITQMATELQRICRKEFNTDIFVCIGQEALGIAEFMRQVEQIRKKIPLRHLVGNHSIIDLNKNDEMWNEILDLADNYRKLADALYIADEKNMLQEREIMFLGFNILNLEEMNLHVYAALLALSYRFDADNMEFSVVFGKAYDYIKKVSGIGDMKSLKMWLTNYFAWVMDYAASKLNVSENNVIIKAKRYMADFYENADLSLSMVAEYVNLNEKYFTNRFTKETGETFSSYLTGLRVHKAKELLKTTTFKVYEIAEMVGYYNAEHFSRMFRKVTGYSPVQYRKTVKL